MGTQPSDPNGILDQVHNDFDSLDCRALKDALNDDRCSEEIVRQMTRNNTASNSGSSRPPHFVGMDHTPNVFDKPSIIGKAQSKPQSFHHKPTSSFKVVQSSHPGLHRRSKAAARREENERWSENVQKASERRAMDSLNIIHWVTVLSENKVDRRTLKDAAKHLKPADYREDVIIERHSSGLCGYPLCDKSPRRPYTNSDLPQLQICLSRRKLLDVKQSSQFCSTTCLKRSEWYEKSVLGREPDWAKAQNRRFEIGAHGLLNDQDDIKLLEEIEEEQATISSSASTSTMKQNPGVLNELIAPLLKSSAKEDLEQILASLTITEHAPISFDQALPLPLPPSPRQSTTVSMEDYTPVTPKSNKRARDVRWADDSALDEDEPMLEAETYESLGEMIKQQSVLSDSNAGSYQRRYQTRALLNDGGDENLMRCGWDSEVVYNVGSDEDRMAIDWAMSLRDQLRDDDQLGP
ncbi:hypothetical protein DFH28DRAFT_945903 [Melampsora americana]|nr:hypothetical protein DFH28DRAFT_945903 [Melampsora americana]